MRKLIGALLDWQERIASQGSFFSLLEAPTGYGKTSSGALLFLEAEKQGSAGGYVHVLPLRAIVDDLYRKLVCCSSCPCKSLPGVDCRWLGSHSIGYQMMGYIAGYEDNKTPYFLRDIVVTTFDSFVYNLARIPVAELGKPARHYEIPRSAILSSLVVVDEAHLYGGDIGADDKRMFDVLVSSIRVLTGLGVPVLVESATLPEIVSYRLMAAAKKAPRARFRFSRDERLSGQEHDIWDSEYAEQHGSIRWRTEVVDESQALRKALEELRSGRRVLAMFNTPRKAMEAYRWFLEEGVREEEVVLLHGRLTSGDRTRNYSRIKRGGLRGDSKEPPNLVVSTQVIEAGVDISFDTLISEAAPPTVLTQRAGRVARYGGDVDARVYVFRGEDPGGVYDSRVVDETLKLISSKQVEWRLPVDDNNTISYKTLIEAVYSRFEKTLGSGNVRIEDVMKKPLATNKDVNNLLKEACCSLVREPLLQGYVVGEDEISKSSLEVDAARTLVLNLGLARKLLKKGALYTRGSNLLVIRLDEDGTGRIIEVGQWALWDCNKALAALSGNLLPVKERFYEKGVGLHA